MQGTLDLVLFAVACAPRLCYGYSIDSRSYLCKFEGILGSICFNPIINLSHEIFHICSSMKARKDYFKTVKCMQENVGIQTCMKTIFFFIMLDIYVNNCGHLKMKEKLEHLWKYLVLTIY